MDTQIRWRAGYFTAAAGSAMLVAACMGLGPPLQQQETLGAGRQCFNARMVHEFRPVDRDFVHVTVGARNVFELRTVGYCPDIDWSLRIAIRSTSDSSWVCRGLDAELLVPSETGQGFDRCLVTSVRQLSPQEVLAWRARRR